jgi:hypothetical protein
MEILFHIGEWTLIKLLLQKVLDSFDIMVGDLLDSFHPLSIFFRKVFEDAIQKAALLLDQGNLGGIFRNNLFSKQPFEPLNFYKDSEPHQGKL